MIAFVRIRGALRCLIGHHQWREVPNLSLVECERCAALENPPEKGTQ